MKKTLIIGLILSISMMFISCESNEAKKTIEQAVISMENKDYEEAMSLLDKAIKEQTGNKDTEKLYSIVDDYKKADEELRHKNFDEAKEILDGIDERYVDYAIKSDIDSLKKEVEFQLKESRNIDKYLAEAEQLFQDRKYDSAKNFLYINILGLDNSGIGENEYANENQKEKAIALINKCDEAIYQIEMTDEYERQKAEGERQQAEAEAEIERLEEERQRLEEEREWLESEREIENTRNEYIRRLDRIEVELNQYDYLYNGSYEDLKQVAKITLTRWDDILNEIYDLLEIQLSESEMDALVQEELNWIEYRDEKAMEAAADGLQDGTAEYDLTSAESTRRRCYELVNIYMR